MSYISAGSRSSGKSKNAARFELGPAMSSAREHATATLLPSGAVLLAGGYDKLPEEVHASAELYDPADGAAASTGSMLEPRHAHSAALLPDGRVLIVGGRHATGAPGTVPTDGAEVFDPATGELRATGPLSEPRSELTATLIAGGRVLVAGGYPKDKETDGTESTEVYEPMFESFYPGPPMEHKRSGHAAVDLEDGTVLMIGGRGGAFAERFVALSKPFAFAGQPIRHRFQHTATRLWSGQVLVAGGVDPGSETLSDDDPIETFADAELWTDGAFAPTAGPMQVARRRHAAAPLPDGTVLLAGGRDGTGVSLASAEIYDPEEGFAPVGPMERKREGHTVTVLSDQAHAIVVGDWTPELYDIASRSFELLPFDLHQRRSLHTATLLDDGRVLVAGGNNEYGDLATIELFDGATLVPPPEPPCAHHTATVLPSGELLVVGGKTHVDDDESKAWPTAAAYFFDPRDRSLLPAGTLSVARWAHTATPLGDGRVLVAGGGTLPVVGGGATDSVEIWQGGSFAPAGPLGHARGWHSATRLANGRVLVAGGRDLASALASAELYDAEEGTFALTGSMAHPRYKHAAARLPSGEVLVVGGVIGEDENAGREVLPAEIYDPATGAFRVIKGDAPIKGQAYAAALPSGDVLAMGDRIVYRYDASTEAITVVGDGPIRAVGASVLPGGRMALCGVDRCDVYVDGVAAPGEMRNGAQRDGHSLSTLPTAEAFLLGRTPMPSRHTFAYRLSPSAAMRPVVEAVPARVTAGKPFTIHGARFSRMSARGSGALGPLPSVLPLVYVAPVDSSAPLSASVVRWDDEAIDAEAPRTPYPGGAWLYVVVAGVASEGRYLTLDPVSQADACLLDLECATGHCTDGVCCSESCRGKCESCLAAAKGDGEDGVCGPVKAGGAPRSGCEKTESVCSATGECDGLGDCAYPDAATTCDAEKPGGRCKRGVCERDCASNLDCPSGLVCDVDQTCQERRGPGTADAGCAVRRGGPSDPPARRIAELLIAAFVGALVGVRRASRR